MLVCLYKTKQKKKEEKKDTRNDSTKKKKASIKIPLENLDLDQFLQIISLRLTHKTLRRNYSTQINGDEL